jgi:DNA polymerase-1
MISFISLNSFHLRKPLFRKLRLLDSFSIKSYAVKTTKSTKKHVEYDVDLDDDTTNKKILIVNNVHTAERVLANMISYSKNNDDVIWACDTEVADIDVKKVGPVGNGKVVCVSLYGGRDFTFDGQKGQAIWIDNIGEADGILQCFKSWFESDKYSKVWHNYGFDRHVMQNEGIKCGGFKGDTMHMARLFDTSRDKISAGSGYSLESLSHDLLKNIKDVDATKTSMKDLFGVEKTLLDGGKSKIKVLPNIYDLQNDEETRDKWIEYSAKDAIATYFLYQTLKTKLNKKNWVVDNKPIPNKTLFDFYENYLIDFGQLLTDMESIGIKVFYLFIFLFINFFF